MVDMYTTDSMEPKEYVGLICHELKTPLTVLNAIIQLLDKKIGNNADENVNRTLAKADEQVKKMGNLINSFLRFSLINTVDTNLNEQRFMLSHLIGEVAENLRGFSKQHLMVLDCCDGVFINADREKISCVLSNIICNAIKYSPGGRFVYLKCFKSGNNALVRVRDDGIGIEAKYIDQIFDKQFRIANEKTRNVDGQGIGLYLSAAIIKKHGGKIWATSQPGQGSTFSFSLPLI